MKHDMEAIIKLAWHRHWTKQERMQVDNMRGVSMERQFLNEVMAAMGETHAAIILEEYYGRKFTPTVHMRGGKPDFGGIEVKSDARDDAFVNININASREWRAVVKFYTNISTGESFEKGWDVQSLFYNKAKLIEKPMGRSYYHGELTISGSRWVEYA